MSTKYDKELANICTCKYCGNPVTEQNEWDFDEEEKAPRCQVCGNLLDLPEGY